MKIWHVYYSTRGAAGAYIDVLQKAMWDLGIASGVAVSRGYRFKTLGIVKLFFPITDGLNYCGPGRRTLRGAELLLGYALILLASAIR